MQETSAKVLKVLMDLGAIDKVVIFDIDGTLAKIDHRLKHLEGMTPDWDAFFSTLEEDAPNEWCVKLARLYFNAGYRVYLVSGRPDKYKEKTFSWLEKHGIPYHDLFMRKEGDYRADDIIKKEILHNHFDLSKIELVIDDRRSVIDMWRKEGLICLACADN